MEYPIKSDLKVLKYDDNKFAVGKTIIESEGEIEKIWFIVSSIFNTFELANCKLNEILLKNNNRKIQTREEQLLLPYKYKIDDVVDFKFRNNDIVSGKIVNVGSLQKENNEEQLVYIIGGFEISVFEENVIGIHKRKKKKKYYKCECGSEIFVRIYNVWNEKIKVEISELNGEECLDVEELGKEKDHLVGYICAKCRKSANKLNDGL